MKSFACGDRLPHAYHRIASEALGGRLARSLSNFALVVLSKVNPFRQESGSQRLSIVEVQDGSATPDVSTLDDLVIH
jgi:hypothetical protein